MHPQARTTPLSRREIVALVHRGEAVAAVARRFKISRPTVYKWLARFAQGGAAGLADRPPIAKRFPTRVRASVERHIERLRRGRRLLGWQIADVLSLARSTVIKVLKRLKLARLRDLEPARLMQRYEYRRPGELVHLDIKKIARFERETMLREWAYAIAYRTSDERRAALPAWLRYYNEERRHSAINYETPASRWALARKRGA